MRPTRWNGFACSSIRHQITPIRDADITAAIADPRFRERALVLSQLDVTDEGPIAASITDVTHDNRELNTVAIMDGPKTVAALLDNYLACAQALKTARNDRGLNDEYQRLRTPIATTRIQSFIAAIMERDNVDDPILIASLASIVSLHGGADRRLPIAVDPRIKPQLVMILHTWVDVVISSPSSERYQLNEVSNAIGSFGLRELVPGLKRLLDEDRASYEASRRLYGCLGTRRYSGDVRCVDAICQSIPSSILAPRWR